MAQTQYMNTGKENDITSVITNISPYETPLVSLFGTAERARNIIHSWMEDSLRPPKSNAQKEGFTYVTDTATEPKLLSNVCQIFSQGYGVTKTSQAISRKNIKNKLAYNMTKAMKEVALDMEYAIINNSQKVMGNDDSSRKMGGLPYFIQTNIVSNPLGAGTPRSLTWDLINSTIELCKKCGGSPDTIVPSLRNKRVISALLPKDTTRHIKGGENKVGAVIEVFVSDFGALMVKPDRWLSDSDVYVLDSQYFGLSYLRNFKKEDLPNTSDNLNKIIVGELTLEARAEASSARITDLNGTVPTA